MTFSEVLNKYIEQINCSSKDLSTTSQLSSAVISRYRKGERTPALKSKQFDQLVDGLYELSKNNNTELSKKEIASTLASSLNDIDINFEDLSKNINAIISALNINIADLSRFIGYDASFISKIRSGNRNPSKPKEFISSVCSFIVNKYKSAENKETLSILMDCSITDLENEADYSFELNKWISTNSYSDSTYISNFLNHLDTFDLNEYIKAIHFDEMKIPFVPFYKASSRNYYGLEEMKKSELDFFKATVLSKSTEPVFMCSDMPMEDMAEDVDFGKKWMFAIAMTLKKGLHLNIIHNLDRPFEEMMLGLESWIPIYMTGQISPFYFKNANTNIYGHLNYVSGTVALNGESINGYHSDGKYYLTTNKSEIAYYKSKADHLLKKANSLMDIYRAENQNEFNAFLISNSKLEGKRRRILSSLPIHTMSKELLAKILKRNKVSEADINSIYSELEKKKKIISDIVKNDILEDDYFEFSKKDFEKHLISLSLSTCFFEKKIYYTYDEYKEHLKLTHEYEKNTPNYKLTKSPNRTFKNIQVTFHDQKYIMISKDNSPAIHFVVYNPKLRNAIENFIPPIIEE